MSYPSLPQEEPVDIQLETLRGRFDEFNGRPLVEALVILPRLGLRAPMTFVVSPADAGCQVGSVDSQRLGVSMALSSFSPDDEGSEITAETLMEEEPLPEHLVEEALIVFAGKANLYVYHVEVDLHLQNAELGETPSVIGREILDRWKMTYDPSNRMLVFKVLDTDEVIPYSV